MALLVESGHLISRYTATWVNCVHVHAWCWQAAHTHTHTHTHTHVHTHTHTHTVARLCVCVCVCTCNACTCNSWPTQCTDQMTTFIHSVLWGAMATFISNHAILHIEGLKLRMATFTQQGHCRLCCLIYLDRFFMAESTTSNTIINICEHSASLLGKYLCYSRFQLCLNFL